MTAAPTAIATATAMKRLTHNLSRTGQLPSILQQNMTRRQQQQPIQVACTLKFYSDHGGGGSGNDRRNDNDNLSSYSSPSNFTDTNETSRMTTAHRIIEPTIRSRPFRRHFRGSSSNISGGAGSFHGYGHGPGSGSLTKVTNKSSSSSLRRLAPTSKRVNLVQSIGSSGAVFGGGVGDVHQRSKPSDTFQGDRWDNGSRWENHDHQLHHAGQPQQQHQQPIQNGHYSNQQQHHIHQRRQQLEDESFRAPIRAVHVGQSIDLAKVISKVFATKSQRKLIERLSVVVQLQPLPVDPTSMSSSSTSTSSSSLSNRPRFVAVFRFGSVVFFNVSPREASDLLSEIKQYTTQPVLSGSERKENYCVLVQPTLIVQQNGGTATVSRYHHRYYTHQNYQQHFDEQQSRHNSAAADNMNTFPEPPELEIVTGDHCIVPELNLKAVDVISSTMAQSVALDSYNDTVDALLAKFEKVNKSQTNLPDNKNISMRSKIWRFLSGEDTTRRSSSKPPLDRDELFRAVAQNNSIFIEMVSKVGIKDRIDTAWNMSQYEDISEGMREEFDIDQRFEHIEFKLDLIQQNAKFFLEILAHQKSNSLEIIIIVLIAFECILMIAEMYLTVQGMT
jgi:uncharacterized Rmd1/YagE family protein